jgi:hypothetical protein
MRTALALVLVFLLCLPLNGFAEKEARVIPGRLVKPASRTLLEETRKIPRERRPVLKGILVATPYTYQSVPADPGYHPGWIVGEMLLSLGWLIGMTALFCVSDGASYSFHYGPSPGRCPAPRGWASRGRFHYRK